METCGVKISIIIPVFNCETYLIQCLDSVLNQTIRDLEVICVDDGSTDASAAIIRQYVEKDNRVVFLRQENNGPAVARNRALKIAKGKYIAFLDADDFYIDTDAVEKMYYLCEKKNVSVCGAFRRNLEPYGYRNTYMIQNEQEFAQQGTVLQYIDYQFDYEYQNFIFLRALILQNEIEFPHYRRFEDPPFLVQALYAAQNFVMADTNLYCYRVPNLAQRYTTQNVAEMLLGLKDNLFFAHENGLELLFDRTLNRVEYEFNDVIQHYLPDNDTTILERLISINAVVQLHFSDAKRMIRPLKRIVEATKKECCCYQEKLLNQIRKSHKVLIFGAGKFAQNFLRFLKDNQLFGKVAYIMVSSANPGNNELDGIPIISLQEANQLSLYSELVFIAAGGLAQKEVMDMLMQNGYVNYELMDNIFLSEYGK